MRWLCLFIVLAAASVFSQSDIPSRRISHTNALVNIAPSNTSLEALVDWVDSNWSTNIDPSEVYWSADDHNSYASGIASTAWVSNNFMRGTDVVGADYNSTTKVWTVDWLANAEVLDYLAARSSVDGFTAFSTLTGISTSVVGTTHALMTNGWVISQSSGLGILGLTNGVLYSPTNTILLLMGQGALKQATNAEPAVTLRFFDVGSSFTDRTFLIGGAIVRHAYEEDDPAVSYTFGSGTFVIPPGVAKRYIAPGVTYAFGVTGKAATAYKSKWYSISAVLLAKPGE